jgi:hypothetical protein
MRTSLQAESFAAIALFPVSGHGHSAFGQSVFGQSAFGRPYSGRTSGNMAGAGIGEQDGAVAAYHDQDGQWIADDVRGVLSREPADLALRDVDATRDAHRALTRLSTRVSPGTLPDSTASDLQVRINRINDRLRFNPHQ